MIHEILPVNNYQGNDSSTNFDFDFYIENESQLNVYLFNADGTKEKLELNVDYSINELKNSNGSYITFPLASSKHGVLTSGQKISLELTLPISQETQYNNSSLLNLKALEYSLDYLTRLIQILARKLTRCIKVDECSDSTPDGLLESINQAQINSQNQADRAEQMFESTRELAQTQTFIKSLLTNCILLAPNGVMTYSGSIITVKSGLRVLIPNGHNENGTLNNIDYTLLNDAQREQTTTSGTHLRFISIDNQGVAHGYMYYFAQEQNPKVLGSLWYKPSENKMYRIWDNVNTPEVVFEALVGSYLAKDGVIKELNSYNAASFLKRSDFTEVTTLSFPSEKYIPLALGTTGSTYAAPADGFYQIVLKLGASKFLYISYPELPSSGSSANQQSVFGYYQGSSVSTASNIAYMVPVRKGQKIKITYDGEKVAFNFIYAMGVA